MEAFKSTASRLARVFYGSREKWKAKALTRQKELRAAQIRMRDLEASRERWKARAREAEAQLRQEKGAGRETAEEGSPGATSIVAGAQETVPKWAWHPAAGHVYPLYVVQLAVQLMVEAMGSLRGSAHTFVLFKQFFKVPTPSYGTVRQWLLRVGLHALRRPVANLSGWTLLLDLTVQLGRAKALVIVGVGPQRLRRAAEAEEEVDYALRHRDLRVLALEVLEQSSGEVIADHLERLGKQSGVPAQVITDGGSDVKKAVALYRQNHPQVIDTDDVTHCLARLLKQELQADARFESWSRRCAEVRRELQQTELSFLLPPGQRSQARFLNVHRLVDWARRLLGWQARGDFSPIDTAHAMDAQTYHAVFRALTEPQTRRLVFEVPWREFADARAFGEALGVALGAEVFARHREPMLEAADLGRRRYEDKLGWLEAYREEIEIYAELVRIIHAVEKQLKTKGLHAGSREVFERLTEAWSLSPRAERFRQRVLEYLMREGVKIPPGQTLLATTDGLESLFGMYKFFANKSPLKELGKMLLMIPLRTVKLSVDFVKEALEQVRAADVEKWARNLLGPSALAARRTALAPPNKTQK